MKCIWRKQYEEGKLAEADITIAKIGCYTCDGLDMERVCPYHPEYKHRDPIRVPYPDEMPILERG